MKKSKKAVVLLSGGLDSTTCLAVAQNSGFSCYVLSFDYGQKHRAELLAAQKIATHCQVAQHEIVKLSLDHLLNGTQRSSALTDNKISVPDYADYNNQRDTAVIPVTYVPARNTTFLAIALGWAEVLEAEAIFIGVSAVDYSGYPDCRPDYIAAFQQMATLATKAGVEGHPINIETPLIYLNKAATIQLGNKLGVDYAMTVSCYRATESGLACGRCDSCVLRKKGFQEANITDPTRYSDF